MIQIKNANVPQHANRPSGKLCVFVSSVQHLIQINEITAISSSNSFVM